MDKRIDVYQWYPFNKDTVLPDFTTAWCFVPNEGHITYFNDEGGVPMFIGQYCSQSKSWNHIETGEEETRVTHYMYIEGTIPDPPKTT